MTKIEEVFKDILGIIWGEEKEEKPKQKKEKDIGQYIGLKTEKPKRARTKKGRYKADDKSTKDVNEAWVGGKAPKKKRKK